MAHQAARKRRLVNNDALFARVIPAIQTSQYRTAVGLRRASGDGLDSERWRHLQQNFVYPRYRELRALSAMLDIPYAELDGLCPIKGADADDSEAHAA